MEEPGKFMLNSIRVMAWKLTGHVLDIFYLRKSMQQLDEEVGRDIEMGSSD